MNQNIFLNLFCVITSCFLIISVFGRKKRSLGQKYFLLIAGDVLLACALLFFPLSEWNKEIILLLVFGVLNVFALKKMYSGQNPDQEVLNAWHDDSSNWKAGIFYYNPKDKRIFPPKRIEGFGWTVNFANPYSILALLGLIAVILLAALILK